MNRVWKILIALAVAIVVLLAVNTIVLESQSEDAEVTTDGGKILNLSSGDVQITDSGQPSGSAGQPIVLIHGYAGSLQWFDKLVPLLSADHRVIRIDLLGFGGSEKPGNGYAIAEQARLVAEALNKLGVQGAMVVGHSMGAAVTASLAEQASELVDRAVLIDQAPDDSGQYGFDVPFLQDLSYKPVLGEALWRLTPDFAIRDGLEKAFAPGFDFEDGFASADDPVDSFREMTYSSYEDAFKDEKNFLSEAPLNQRFTSAPVPLMVIFGSEDQIYDARRSIAGYDGVPGVITATIKGAGHSPQVEKPKQVAARLERFAAPPAPAPSSGGRGGNGGNKKSNSQGKKAQGGGARGSKKAGSKKNSGSSKRTKNSGGSAKKG